MKMRTYCLACRKHTNNVGLRNITMTKSDQKQIKMWCL